MEAERVSDRTLLTLSAAAAVITSPVPFPLPEKMLVTVTSLLEALLRAP
jgi:hypothetical protein